MIILVRGTESNVSLPFCFLFTSCLLCNNMFKSSSEEGHQLKKKMVKTKAPIYTSLPHSNTVFSVHKKDYVTSKTVFNEIIRGVL